MYVPFVFTEDFMDARTILICGTVIWIIVSPIAWVQIWQVLNKPTHFFQGVPMVSPSVASFRRLSMVFICMMWSMISFVALSILYDHFW